MQLGGGGVAVLSQRLCNSTEDKWTLKCNVTLWFLFFFVLFLTFYRLCLFSIHRGATAWRATDMRAERLKVSQFKGRFRKLWSVT